MAFRRLLALLLLASLLLIRAADVRVVCENLASKIPQGDTMSAHIRFAGGGEVGPGGAGPY